jgi:hypothetical protein
MHCLFVSCHFEIVFHAPGIIEVHVINLIMFTFCSWDSHQLKRKVSENVLVR